MGLSEADGAYVGSTGVNPAEIGLSAIQKYNRRVAGQYVGDMNVIEWEQGRKSAATVPRGKPPSSSTSGSVHMGTGPGN